MKEFEKINYQDAISSISRIDNKSGGSPTTSQVARFNLSGVSDEKSKKKFPEHEVCAVQLKAGRNNVYKIKTSRGGKFYNPLKNGATYGLNVQSRAGNDSMFQLREVNKKAFDNYVKFLQTRYDSYLMAAEREY
jgi:hypothetical protein